MPTIRRLAYSAGVDRASGRCSRSARRDAGVDDLEARDDERVRRRRGWPPSSRGCRRRTSRPGGAAPGPGVRPADAQHLEVDARRPRCARRPSPRRPPRRWTRRRATASSSRRSNRNGRRRRAPRSSVLRNCVERRDRPVRQRRVLGRDDDPGDGRPVHERGRRAGSARSRSRGRPGAASRTGTPASGRARRTRAARRGPRCPPRRPLRAAHRLRDAVTPRPRRSRPGAGRTRPAPGAAVGGARWMSSSAGRPTWSMNTCSSVGSATSKWRTRAPAAIAAASTWLGLRRRRPARPLERSMPGLDARACPGTDGQPRQPVVALDRDPDQPPARGPAHVAQRPADDHPAAIDDRDRLAQRLRDLHLVGREDDRPAAVPQLEERLAQEHHVDRVEAGERLVHQQHLRVVQDRGDELDLLLVALGQLLGPAPREVLGPEPRAATPAPRASRDVRGHALQPGEEHELLQDPHPRVQAALLGQVAPTSSAAAGGCRSRASGPRRRPARARRA